MANCQKYKLPGTGHLLHHYARHTGETIQRKNEKIHPDRTYLNYDIHTGATADGDQHETEKQMERLHQRLDEVKHPPLTGDNINIINVMCDWIVTLPKDVPPEREREFFQHCYDFISDRYGKENVLSAWVHKDENTPHMHLSFVPVVKDENGERLCAKEVICNTELCRFHPELQRYVEGKMNQSVGILNGATAGGNLTIAQLKLQEVVKQLAQAQTSKDTMEKALPMIAEVNELMENVSKLYGELDTALKAKKFFKDNDKVRLEEVGKELDTMRQQVTATGAATQKLMETLKDVNAIVETDLSTAYKNIQEMAAKADRRLKRKEKEVDKRLNALKEQEQQLQADRENLDELTAQKAKEQYQELVQEKQDEISELDEMIAEKTKEITFKNKLAENVTANFWGQADYLVKADENQRAFEERVKGGAGRDRHNVQTEGHIR